MDGIKECFVLLERDRTATLMAQQIASEAGPSSGPAANGPGAGQRSGSLSSAPAPKRSKLDGAGAGLSSGPAAKGPGGRKRSGSLSSAPAPKRSKLDGAGAGPSSGPAAKGPGGRQRSGSSSSAPAPKRSKLDGAGAGPSSGPAAKGPGTRKRSGSSSSAPAPKRLKLDGGRGKINAQRKGQSKVEQSRVTQDKKSASARKEEKNDAEPYLCEICSLRFSSELRLETHDNIYHAISCHAVNGEDGIAQSMDGTNGGNEERVGDEQQKLGDGVGAADLGRPGPSGLGGGVVDGGRPGPSGLGMGADVSSRPGPSGLGMAARNEDGDDGSQPGARARVRGGRSSGARPAAPGRYACAICPARLDRKKDLQIHVTREHPDACPCCGGLFAHDNETQEPGCCRSCLVDVDHLRAHTVWQHRAFFCQLCGVPFSSANALQAHGVAVHDVPHVDRRRQ